MALCIHVKLETTLYLCRCDDGHSSDDLRAVGDLLLGANHILQHLLVLRVLLPVTRLGHLRGKPHTRETFMTYAQTHTQGLSDEALCVHTLDMQLL